MSRQGLIELPEFIGELSQIWSLNLTENQLTTLPESIGRLAKLESLYLDHNRLARLPASLRELNSLEELFLHGNDALGLPAEVLGPRWEIAGKNPSKTAEILEYYFRVRGGR